VNLSSILGFLTLHSDPSTGSYDEKVFTYDACHLPESVPRRNSSGANGLARLVETTI
jgi:hypothetical protein